MKSPEEVANWMYEQLIKSRLIYQSDMVTRIRVLHGKEFVYKNQNGSDAIHKDVLKCFRKLYEGQAVWERGSLGWRLLAKSEKDKGSQ